MGLLIEARGGGWKGEGGGGLERVSSQHIASVHAVCGGSIISSTSSLALANAKVGGVKDIKRITHLNRQ